MRAAELCAGYGGLYLGLKHLLPQARMSWYAETDKHASRVLRERHTSATGNAGDITGHSGSYWKSFPRPHVLMAGTPCQDLSVAGKGAGLEGERSGILLDALRIVELQRPDHFVWENVRAATYRKGELPNETVVGTVERRLTEAGYRVTHGVFSASQVGAPHLRERVFLLASLPGASLPGVSPNPGPILPTPTVVDMGNNKTQEEWQDWISRMREKHRNGNGHGRSLSQEVRYNFEGYMKAVGHWDSVLTGSFASIWDRGQALPTPTSSMSTGPGTSGRQGGWNLQTAIHELGMPNTIDGSGRMSVEFVEWMMGLPRGWVTGVEGISRTQQLKMLGNGVVPLQAAYAIDQLNRIQNSKENTDGR